MWDLALSATVALAAWSLSLFVLRDRPGRPLNRRLSALLAAEGLLVLTIFHAGAPEAAHHEGALLALGVGAGWSVVILGLRFLACLDTPLSRPLSRPRVDGALLALLALAWAHAAAAAGWHLGTRAPVGQWGEAMDIASGVAAILISAFSLVVGASALRRAPRGSLARDRARAYLLAFGARDVGLALGVAIGLLLIPTWHGAAEPAAWAETASRALPRAGSLAYCLALAWGILRVQLLDLGLRARLRVPPRALSAAIVAAGLLALGAALLLARAPAALIVLALVGLAAPLHLAAMAAAERLARALRLPERVAERRRLLALAAAEDERELPRFVEETEIGSGGQGRAFRAWDRVLDRRVVVKEAWGQAGATALQEARAAARIDHPNVVRLHDVSIERGRARLVFEHVDGETLGDLLRREGALPEARATRLALDVLDGLEAIHRAGLVHADVKPDNVLVGTDGRARLLDLGTAALQGGRSSGAGSGPYASPELREARPLDARSDVFAVGVLLAHALDGAAPNGRTRAAWEAAASEPPRPRPALPGPLAEVVRRATRAAPASRYADAAAMRLALLQANSSLPTGIPAR